MAMAPTAAPAGDPTMDAPAPDDAGAPAAPTVLYTIMDNHDGTVTLVQGDEPDEGTPDMGAGAMPPPGMGGAPPGMPSGMGGPPGAPPPMPEEGGEQAPVGDVFDPQSLGDMLNAVMKGCDDAMSAAGGETQGNEEADMMGAFGGAPAPA